MVNEKSYLVNSQYSDKYDNIISKILDKKEYFKNINKLLFVYVDGRYGRKKNLIKIPNYEIINFLDNNKEVITYKDNLYTNMKVNFPKIYNKYFPDQLSININNINIMNIKNFFIKYKKIILKPTHGRKGQGIQYFNDSDQLINYILKLKKINKCFSEKWNRNCYYVMSEIIEDLQLYDKKKFHIRTYFLHSSINNIHKSYIYYKGLIITAKKEYNKNSLDKDVVDTHMKSTEKIKYMTLSKYEKQFKELFNCVHKLLENNKVNGYNTKNGYQLFGIDILITDKNIIKLLEINNMQGMGNHIKKEYNKILTETFKLTIDKIFSNNDYNSKCYFPVG